MGMRSVMVTALAGTALAAVALHSGAGSEVPAAAALHHEAATAVTALHHEASTAGATPARTPLAAAVEIPLSVRNGRPVVPVKARDEQLDFVLSTGSGSTVLSASLAERLGEGPELWLGEVPVPMQGAATLPDEQLTIDGVTIDGMIGANTLNQFDVLVDVPGGRLVLQEIGAGVSWDGMTLSEPVRMRVLHGIVLSFQVELGGRTYPATMDLGTPMLVVNPGVKTDLQLADEDTATLSLGGATQPDLPVHVLDLPMLRRFSPDGAGFVLVGAPVVWDCALSLSWVHQELRTCVR
jgi:hypothetical protein